MDKPTMVFVPGAWHSSDIYGTTMDELAAYGYPTVAVELPSVGADPAHTSFDGDVHAVRTRLSHLVEDEGKEVILVSHSYSSMPALDACYGLARRHRSEQGLHGGVIRLVLIMAFAVPEGFQPTASGAQYPYWMRVDVDKAVVNVLPEDAKAIFYNDIPDEEGDKWAARLRPQSVGVYSSITTYAAWRDIASTYVIGTRDQTTFTPEVVDWMIDKAQKEVPTAFDVIERCEGGGHCMMISYPQWLTAVMRRAAGEKV